jgi:hypothetical protein
MRTLLVVAVVAVVVVVGAGCSSSYIPQARGKVAIILKDGKPAYTRDGEIYEHGLLGGGLVEAVHGNPRAEQAAHEYRSRMGTGFLVGFAGLVCMTVTSVIAISKTEYVGNSHDPEAYMLTALACGVASIAGFSYAITAEPYRWDAVNMFNDDADRQLQQFQATPPGWSAARKAPEKKQSLKMRE